ncbi:RluA family pseudouridine synthase [Phosphitispora sp. TUW77]|uniref:RluA family pseudouridine synthase n=1 Tax=Phosphitispora sp. TUW77 TaxID=3152361 RepID=UPI003AB3EF04
MKKNKGIEDYIATGEHEGTRLDIFIAGLDSNFSRSRVQKLVESGAVTVNGGVAKSNYKVREGDFVCVKTISPEQQGVQPENIPLDIVYEDSDLLVVNKPQGMVAHPAAGNYSGTLVNALLFHCDDLSGINGVIRPGIVHRIDKDTSGLLVVAKNDFAHLSLAEQFKEHSISRKYIALVHGVVMEPGGIVDAPLGRDPRDRKKMAVVTRNAKKAITKYRVLERFNCYSLIECQLETGRTHQIRVHMAYLGHPVVGDPVYGPRKDPLNLKGQALHAFLLGFRHPRTEEFMEFKADIPLYFQELIAWLKVQDN